MVLHALILMLAQAPGAADQAESQAEQAERALEGGTAPADPQLALTAAILRAEAGDHAHAWRHLERYLGQPNLGPEDREAGEQRRTGLIASTRVITVQLSRSVPAKVVALRMDARRPMLEFPVVDGKATIRIDLHDWELRVMAPGYAPLQRRVGSTDVVRLLRFLMDPLAPAPLPEAAVPVSPAPRGPSRELVAGAVLLPLGAAALVGVAATIPGYLKTGDELDRWTAELAGRRPTQMDIAELRSLGETAQRQEALISGLGVAAGALVTIGAILVGYGRHHQKARGVGLRGGATIGLVGRF